MGCANLTRTLQVPIVVHPLEADRISEISSNPIKSLDLDHTYGGLIPYHTPGHSPGHVVFYHPDDQILLAGDLFTAFSGKLRRPIAKFTPDMEESLRAGGFLNDWTLSLRLAPIAVLLNMRHRNIPSRFVKVMAVGSL